MIAEEIIPPLHLIKRWGTFILPKWLRLRGNSINNFMRTKQTFPAQLCVTNNAKLVRESGRIRTLSIKLLISVGSGLLFPRGKMRKRERNLLLSPLFINRRRLYKSAIKRMPRTRNFFAPSLQRGTNWKKKMRLYDFNLNIVNRFLFVPLFLELYLYQID